MTDAHPLDSLTGAYTRATFSENLRAHLEQAQREGTPCSLAFFDLDHFKSINDAFGHARGDEALREVARRVRETTRASDMFFRYGGDEFVLLLPNTPKAEAVQLANRLLEVIRTNPIGGETPITLSISVGVATFPEDTSVEHALFEKADARNYEAKRRGRARVIFEESSAAPDLPFDEISRIIERDEALESAQDFLSAVANAEHGVLSVIGVRGVGSSRFLSEVEKRARLQGFEVITLHSSPRLKNKPYGILIHELSDFSFESSDRINLEELDAVLQKQLAASGHERLLISVDDMPDLDWGTVDLLRQLLSHSSISNLGLVTASDPESARLAAPFWASVSEHITINPISASGLRIWLRVLMQWEPPEEFIEWLTKETHGLPHEVERLIKYLLKQGALVKQDTGWSTSENYAAIGADGMRQWQRRATPNNLHAALTSFIGRESELKDVRQLLAKTRLLTVVGPGGMGKTRLTLQVAKETMSSFKDGVWLIELAPVSDSALALYTIASVLGVNEEQSRPLMDTLSTWLSNKELLLILDNCEHLIELCAQFSHNVLSTSPNVRILASSREALDIAGELVYRLPALEIPNLETSLPIGQLTRYTSARLFIERAAFADSAFNVQAEDASLIAQICRQLDGIPLALELAAARLRSLTLAEIAASLNDRLNLLTRGNRGALPRHQTLRSLIDWSYDMLSSEESMLLRRLSIFAGGWTLEAAEQVCIQKRGAEVKSTNISELLQQLANKSLINFDEHSSESRYSMLETIRQYTHEKLVEANEDAELQELHLKYYLHLAEHTEPILVSAQRQEWVKKLETEHDNFRTSLEYACGQNLEAACRLAGTLGWFWYLGDHLNEGRSWCVRVLESMDQTTPSMELAKALNTAGTLTGNLGNHEEARAWLEKSLAIWELFGEQRLFTETLIHLGYALIQTGEDTLACTLFKNNEKVLRASAEPLILAWSLSFWGRALENAQGDYNTAKALHDEAITIGLAVQDTNILGTCYMNLGYWAAKQGDYEAGYRYHLESSKWQKKANTRLRIAIALHNMADMLSMQEKYLEAQPLYAESLILSRALGNQSFIAWTAYRLGYLMVHVKEYEGARELFAESIRIYNKQPEDFITSSLAGCAELRRAQGQLTQAAHILGFVTAHPQSDSRIFLLKIDSVEYEHTLERLHAELSSSDFKSAWESGQKLSLDEALDLAINISV